MIIVVGIVVFALIGAACSARRGAVAAEDLRYIALHGRDAFLTKQRNARNLRLIGWLLFAGLLWRAFM